MCNWLRSDSWLGVAVLGCLLGADPARAQDEDADLGWYFTAEFSTVWVGGNSESFTLGLGSKLGYKWERSALAFEGGSVFQQSSRKSRRAVGTSQADFVLEEETATEKTAEAYFVRGRYDRTVSKLFFLFGGVDWLRNRFSGIDSRLLFGLGAGNNWVDEDRVRFKTDYSATYTFQQDVVENPFVKTDFPGVRVGYDFWWQLTTSTEFESKLISDWNLDNTDDIRLDFYNALPIAISSVLAFKPALQLAWRNDPSLTTVGLVAPDGTETGDSVLVPLQKLDSFFTISLVVKV